MSTIKADNLQNRAGTASVPVDTVVAGSAKAWVNFNGTGVVAIRRAFNVSSITDNGVGSYTVNFTAPMADANYCPVVSTSGISSNYASGLGAVSAAGFALLNIYPGVGSDDAVTCTAAVFS